MGYSLSRFKIKDPASPHSTTFGGSLIAIPVSDEIQMNSWKSSSRCNKFMSDILLQISNISHQVFHSCYIGTRGINQIWLKKSQEGNHLILLFLHVTYLNLLQLPNPIDTRGLCIYAFESALTFCNQSPGLVPEILGTRFWKGYAIAFFFPGLREKD